MFLLVAKTSILHIETVWSPNVGHIDDLYLQGSDTKECLLNISDTQTLFQDWGLSLMSVEKTCLIPAQQITFLRFVLDSVSMIITLTDDKKGKVKANCKALLPTQPYLTNIKTYFKVTLAIYPLFTR